MKAKLGKKSPLFENTLEAYEVSVMGQPCGCNCTGCASCGCGTAGLSVDASKRSGNGSNANSRYSSGNYQNI